MAVFQFLIDINLIVLPLIFIVSLTIVCFIYNMTGAIAYRYLQKRIQIHILDVASQYLSNHEGTVLNADTRDGQSL